jgi:hypothetical protein
MGRFHGMMRGKSFMAGNPGGYTGFLILTYGQPLRQSSIFILCRFLPRDGPAVLRCTGIFGCFRKFLILSDIFGKLIFMYS